MPTDPAVTYALALISADAATGLFDTGAVICSLNDAAEYVDANGYLLETAEQLELADDPDSLTELAEAIDTALAQSPIRVP